MATTVYEVIDLELQDGTEVLVRPLDLKRLRKVMKVIDEMNKASVKDAEDAEAAAKKPKNGKAVVPETTDEEEDNLKFLISACKICLEKQVPALVADEDKFEEALDLPTIWKILEVSAGISMGGPNLMREAGLPGLI